MMSCKPLRRVIIAVLNVTTTQPAMFTQTLQRGLSLVTQQCKERLRNVLFKIRMKVRCFGDTVHAHMTLWAVIMTAANTAIMCARQLTNKMMETPMLPAPQTAAGSERQRFSSAVEKLRGNDDPDGDAAKSSIQVENTRKTNLNRRTSITPDKRPTTSGSTGSNGGKRVLSAMQAVQLIGARRRSVVAPTANDLKEQLDSLRRRDSSVQARKSVTAASLGTTSGSEAHVNTQNYTVVDDKSLLLANPSLSQRREIVSTLVKAAPAARRRSVSSTAAGANLASLTSNHANSSGQTGESISATVYLVKLLHADFEQCTKMAMRQQMKQGMQVLRHHVRCFASWRARNIREVIKVCQVCTKWEHRGAQLIFGALFKSLGWTNDFDYVVER